MKKLPCLKSRVRRWRWAHYYRRFDPRLGKEVNINIGVHGLHPTDPKVLAAWAAEHARWQDMPPDTETPEAGTFAWALDLYTSGNDKWAKYADGTRDARSAIFKAIARPKGHARSRRSPARR